MKKGINVLSLFDGMSCGQIALERSGIEVNQYYASEIDKYAIKVTQHNYPKTIQLGSVVGVSAMVLPDIRLQTAPDNYTSVVSNSQRYKMLGNGWNVETVAHIFSYLPYAL